MINENYQQFEINLIKEYKKNANELAEGINQRVFFLISQ